MSGDKVKHWAEWFGNLVGVGGPAAAEPEEIEMEDLGALHRLSGQIEASEGRLRKEVASGKSRPTDILDVQSYVKSEINAYGQQLDKFNDGRTVREARAWIESMESLYGEFTTKAMERAVTSITAQSGEAEAEGAAIAREAEAAPEAGKKELYGRANQALLKTDLLIRDWTAQIAEGKGLPGIDKLNGPLEAMKKVQTSLETTIKDLLPPLKGHAVDAGDSIATEVPEEKKVEDPEQVLKDCRDWSEAKKRYAQYKSEMQKLAKFRKDTVDAWLQKNLAEKYGLEYGSGKGWVAVGSSDPTSDYDISINKHGTEGGNTKYDYQMVKEFNDHFRKTYGCETGTIFDTNLYASAPPLELKPREGESKEETAARKDIEASNDIGALMKQRRYMSGAEFNDYRVDVLAGIPKEKKDEVARRFQAADDNYRIALQKTIEVLIKLVKEQLKSLNEATQRDEERIAALQTLVDREAEIRKSAGTDLIGGADAMETLAHDLEHECKDFNTRSTNDLYVDATKGVRDAEGKISGLTACVARAGEVQQQAKALAELKPETSPQDRAKAQAALERAKDEFAKQVEALDRSGLKDVPKAIRDGDFDLVAKKFASEAPELYKELGRALSLSMFFANEAYQAGGPFRHVVFAGQAVEQDVTSTHEQAKRLNDDKVRLEEQLGALEHPKDEDKRQAEALEQEIKDLTRRIKTFVDAERTRRRKSLSNEECLDSFNEQLGDFLKDLAHYGDADPGVAIIQSSKYLARLLDAAKLLDENGMFEGTDLKSEITTHVNRLSDIETKLIKARKGQIKMELNEGESAAGFDEVEQRRAMACKVMSDWEINSVASLHRTYADLGKKVNVEVRKRIATGA